MTSRYACIFTKVRRNIFLFELWSSKLGNWWFQLGFVHFIYLKIAINNRKWFFDWFRKCDASGVYHLANSKKVVGRERWLLWYISGTNNFLKSNVFTLDVVDFIANERGVHYGKRTYEFMWIPFIIIHNCRSESHLGTLQARIALRKKHVRISLLKVVYYDRNGEQWFV